MNGEIVERPGLTTAARVVTFDAGTRRDVIDEVATEEPLEIRLRAAGKTVTAAVTMRTPGNDFELAAGFLFSEGVLLARDGLRAITYCTDPEIDQSQRYNVVNVDLAAPGLPTLDALERHFTMSSACGVCGKASIAALRVRAEPLRDELRVPPSLISELPAKMRSAQRVFASTGGLHATALFDANGELLALREDVGRHNALDKVAGWALMNARLPLQGCIALVSGRASYELVQKCVRAGIPILCAVSAPSSLAVQTADSFGVTLCGFVRSPRVNIYTHHKRIARPV